MQSLKQSFVNANKPNSATQSIDSSTNQEDLDSGIISSKPGAGLLWDKPYLSSLKESFEVHKYLVAYIFRLWFFAFLGRRYSESLFRKTPDSNWHNNQKLNSLKDYWMTKWNICNINFAKCQMAIFVKFRYIFTNYSGFG